MTPGYEHIQYNSKFFENSIKMFAHQITPDHKEYYAFGDSQDPTDLKSNSYLRSTFNALAHHTETLNPGSVWISVAQWIHRVLPYDYSEVLDPPNPNQNQKSIPSKPEPKLKFKLNLKAELQPQTQIQAKPNSTLLT